MIVRAACWTIFKPEQRMSEKESKGRKKKESTTTKPDLGRAVEGKEEREGVRRPPLVGALYMADATCHSGNTSNQYTLPWNTTSRSSL